MAQEETTGLIETVIDIRRSAKVTKGGRNFSFGALVVVGDGRGRVGLGYGKAREVPMAVNKGTKEAQQNMVDVNLIGDTIPHEIRGRHGSCRVFMKPASVGTGVKSSGAVRAILEAAGIRNILTKCYGSTNKVNVAKAVMNALERLQSSEETERLRGVGVQMRHPQLS
jgi:small subunit ribosomal protein S5